MIGGVQIAVISGISRYHTIQPAQDYAMKLVLIFGNVAFLILAIVLGEMLLRSTLNSTFKWKTVSETMSREQFDSAVKSGTPLVTLGNFVLNVSEFMNQHPGGRFAISNNIGHDISLYFYGFYCDDG